MRQPLIVKKAVLSSLVLYPDKSECEKYDQYDERDQHASEHSRRSCQNEKQRAKEEKS